jgi:DNA polymerase II small subunit
MLDTRTIVQRFLETKLQVHPDVVRYLSEQDDPGLLERVIAAVPGDTVVVSAKHIPGIVPEKDGARFLTDPSVEVINGIAGSTGRILGSEDYLPYFRDRYHRLGGMIRSRCSPMPIEALARSSRYRQEECTILGMVMEVRSTQNGHRMIDLEDPTGSIRVLFLKDRPVFADAERILPDEVIGARGTLSGDGKVLFADLLYRPDIPMSHAPFVSSEPGRAVLISDVHVGSNTFLEEAWNRFGNWLDEREEISYLLIAGDLVDGIGVYPGQDQELAIKNIYEQYARAGELMSGLPSRIRIVISPGNHDVVRGAEPQPAIPPQFTANFPDNVTFVENPALVNLQGVRILMYHGRSIDDMISLIPGASYDNPASLLDGMLQRRHLAPTYGKRTPIAADRQDRLVIDPIPEVLHTGHIHIVGLTRYRGIIGVNSGTWQSQTAFQRQMNVNPTPAEAVVLDLQTLTPEIVSFLE